MPATGTTQMTKIASQSAIVSTVLLDACATAMPGRISSALARHARIAFIVVKTSQTAFFLFDDGCSSIFGSIVRTGGKLAS